MALLMPFPGTFLVSLSEKKELVALIGMRESEAVNRLDLGLGGGVPCSHWKSFLCLKCG